jgi:hypothetical protein
MIIPQQYKTKIADAITRARETLALGRINPAKDAKHEYERLSSLAEWAGYLILLGVAVEVTEIWWPIPYIGAKWAQTIADTAIAMGVLGELHFGGKSREWGDLAISNADARAVKMALDAGAQAADAQLEAETASMMARIGDAYHPSPFEVGMAKGKRMSAATPTDKKPEPR